MFAWTSRRKRRNSLHLLGSTFSPSDGDNTSLLRKSWGVLFPPSWRCSQSSLSTSRYSEYENGVNYWILNGVEH